MHRKAWRRGWICMGKSPGAVMMVMKSNKARLSGNALVQAEQGVGEKVDAAAAGCASAADTPLAARR